MGIKGSLKKRMVCPYFTFTNNSVHSKPEFISLTTNIDIANGLKKVKYYTRSGTIGVVSYVSETIENQSISDDVIRIDPRQYSGYIYAYLRVKNWRLLIETNLRCGGQPIEPEH